MNVDRANRTLKVQTAIAHALAAHPETPADRKVEFRLNTLRRKRIQAALVHLGLPAERACAVRWAAKGSIRAVVSSFYRNNPHLFTNA